MKILYIDTSTSYLYSGIVDDKKILAEIKKDFGQNLSKEALPEIAKLFDAAKLYPKDIDKIIVVNGPGSFTGIRIGVTIAKVYAWSLNIPIATITSIEAMALSCKEDLRKIPIIDARRGYCYAGIYDRQNREELEPQYLKIIDIDRLCYYFKKYRIITNDNVEIKGEKVKYNPDILKIVSHFKDKDPIIPHAVNPNYLKLTEAEESKL